MYNINIEEYVQKILDTVKESPEKLKAALSNNETIKSILGEDGKLSKDDLDRVVESIKKSAAAKALLGEDGKIGKDDLDRIAGEAKKTGEDLLEKGKDFLSKL